VKRENKGESFIVFMSKNKNKNHLKINFLKKDNFWAKYATKQNSILALMVVILISATGIGIKNKFFPSNVQLASNFVLPDREEIPGWWYKEHFGTSVCTMDVCHPNADPDGDKLTNAQEFYYHTDPFNPNTVGDELNDGELVARGFDPSRPGRMTFDEVLEDDNIILESLVYDTDIKRMVAEANDISKINIPVVAEDKLKISYDIRSEVYQNYLRELNQTVNKYFTKEEASQMARMLESPESDIGNLPLRSTMLAQDLEKITVPISFVTFHKYTISFYQLLGQVLMVPVTGSVRESEAWYDNVQAFLAVQQKLDFEKQVLTKQFGQ